MFLDSIINAIRAPFDFIRTKIFVKGVGQLYKDEVGGLAGQAKALGGQAQAAQGQAAGVAGKAPKKKMGLFSKKKKCGGCGQKLHSSWDQCPYCGAAVNAPPPQQAAPVMSAPMPSPQAGGKMRTMAIDVGGANVMVSGQAGSGWLVPLDGPQTGELFALKSGRCVVGTAPDCDVVLRDPSISGRHAEFSIAGRAYRVQDLGSTNGTYVNDKRISGEELVDGDSIRLGRTNFKFKSMS